MKTLFRIVDIIGMFIFALPALILGGIIGIWSEAFQQGFAGGKNRIS